MLNASQCRRQAKLIAHEDGAYFLARFAPVNLCEES
jgi:hypothetical protein